jgi:hypothetical protein
MKKLTILTLVFTLFASAQKIEYPRYVVDSTGQKSGSNDNSTSNG